MIFRGCGPHREGDSGARRLHAIEHSRWTEDSCRGGETGPCLASLGGRGNRWRPVWLQWQQEDGEKGPRGPEAHGRGHADLGGPHEDSAPASGKWNAGKDSARRLVFSSLHTEASRT